MGKRGDCSRGVWAPLLSHPGTELLAAGSFPASTSQPWAARPPGQARQSVKPPVSIPWPSQRMCVLQTERLSPSPPFSGEGARSLVHSEARSFCQHRAFPQSLQAERDRAWNNGRATFSRKAACPFPVPVLAQHSCQAARSNPLCSPGRGWSGAPVISASLVGSGVRVEPVPPACFHDD